MATDESMASKTEDWIVEQIRAIQVDSQPVFERMFPLASMAQR